MVIWVYVGCLAAPVPSTSSTPVVATATPLVIPPSQMCMFQFIIENCVC